MPSAKTMYAATNCSRVQAAISFYNCDFISHLQFIFTTVISFHISKIVRRNHTKKITSVKSFHIRKIAVHQQKKCTTAKEIVQAAKESAKTIFYCNNTLHDKTPKTRSCPRPSTHPATVVVAPVNPPVASSHTRAMVAQLRSRGDCCHKFWLVTKMAKRWTPAATANLRNKIARGEINPNIQDAAYLGDIVSREHYPEYKSAPPGGCQTAITHFQRLFRCIQLEQELEGGRQQGAGVEEGEGKCLGLCFALFSV